MTKSRWVGAMCAVAALVGATAVHGAASGTNDGQWRMYSGDNAAIKILAARSDQINDGTPPGFGGKQFSAFDKTTGELLWTTELEAGATGAPMTYMHRASSTWCLRLGGSSTRRSSSPSRCRSLRQRYSRSRRR
jgi:hypothetical protein